MEMFCQPVKTEEKQATFSRLQNKTIITYLKFIELQADLCYATCNEKYS